MKTAVSGLLYLNTRVLIELSEFKLKIFNCGFANKIGPAVAGTVPTAPVEHRSSHSDPRPNHHATFINAPQWSLSLAIHALAGSEKAIRKSRPGHVARAILSLCLNSA